MTETTNETINNTIINNDDVIESDNNDNVIESNNNDNIVEVNDDVNIGNNVNVDTNNTTNNTTINDDNYINFETSGLEEYKDIFKNSKISTADFEKFSNKLMQTTTEEAFSDNMIKTYGDKAENVLEDFREITDDIFTDQEKDSLNRWPANYKMMLIKMGNAFNNKFNKLKTNYGLTTEELTAKPETSSLNAKERFEELTKKLINNDYKSLDEYNKLIQERLQVANYLK